MTPALTDLEPKQVWKHFDALAAIPRASTKEAAAREYVLSIAAKHKLEAVHDKVGNTVVRKPAHPGREAAPMALLQGHLDMVCEKNEGTPHNFDTDPIKIRRDDETVARRQRRFRPATLRQLLSGPRSTLRSHSDVGDAHGRESRNGAGRYPAFACGGEPLKLRPR